MMRTAMMEKMSSGPVREMMTRIMSKLNLPAKEMAVVARLRSRLPATSQAIREGDDASDAKEPSDLFYESTDDSS
jgi:hypothetical protein